MLSIFLDVITHTSLKYQKRKEIQHFPHFEFLEIFLNHLIFLIIHLYSFIHKKYIKSSLFRSPIYTVKLRSTIFQLLEHFGIIIILILSYNIVVVIRRNIRKTDYFASYGVVLFIYYFNFHGTRPIN